MVRRKNESGSTTDRLAVQESPQPNPYVKTAIQSVAASNAPTKAFVTDYTYDKDGNIVGTSDYDWTSYTNIIHDGGKRPTTFSGGISIRTTNQTINVRPRPLISRLPTTYRPTVTHPLQLLRFLSDK